MLRAFLYQYAEALPLKDWSTFYDNSYVQFSEGTYLGKVKVKTSFERAFDLIQDETYATNNIKWIERQTSWLFAFTPSLGQV